MKKISVIQWLAWFYALAFLLIFVICHWPGLTDSSGRLLGLFFIDPIDDIFHLLSGLLGAIVAFHSHRWSVNYFKWVGIPYGIDAFVGLFFSTQFLNGDVFTKPLGGIDFSMHNFLVALPHIIILFSMLWIGFWLSKRVRDPKAVS